MLDLADYEFASLPADAFRGLDSLETLNLRDNRIVRFDGAFRGLGNLRWLEMSKKLDWKSLRQQLRRSVVS